MPRTFSHVATVAVSRAKSPVGSISTVRPSLPAVDFKASMAFAEAPYWRPTAASVAKLRNAFDPGVLTARARVASRSELRGRPAKSVSFVVGSASAVGPTRSAESASTCERTPGGGAACAGRELAMRAMDAAAKTATPGHECFVMGFNLGLHARGPRHVSCNSPREERVPRPNRLPLGYCPVIRPSLP